MDQEETKAEPRPPLSAEAEGFCQAYCSNGFNATKAYERAVNEMISDASLGTQGCKYLKKPGIKERIAEICEDRKRAFQLDGNAVLHELMCIAFADVSSVLTDGVVDLDKLQAAPEHVRRAVESVESTVGKDGVKRKVKFSNKLRALELLGKNPALRLFVEQTEVNGDNPVNVTVKFIDGKEEEKK